MKILCLPLNTRCVFFFFLFRQYVTFLWNGRDTVLKEQQQKKNQQTTNWKSVCINFQFKCMKISRSPIMEMEKNWQLIFFFSAKVLSSPPSVIYMCVCVYMRIGRSLLPLGTTTTMMMARTNFSNFHKITLKYHHQRLLSSDRRAAAMPYAKLCYATKCRFFISFSRLYFLIA